ncbi:MAG: 3-deoxy-manno-octulosonate cytidylyltransferase, partial [Bacteroidales bacterium]|nr:3-deoxy-manno-octulosonate cytidylyltransferase [Bacteroidales bacterium]
SGTERCAEALEYAKNKFKVNFSHVVNIQGDEPFIKPQQILQLTEVLKDEKVEIATLAQKITDKNQLFDNNVVKLVFSHSNKAIYFSRATIPFIRGKKTNEWFEQTDFYKHIGIYAYRSDILPKLPLLKKHPLEIFESLEQNRWLANDLVIKVALTKYESPSVDTPDDLKYIEKLINTGKITIK